MSALKDGRAPIVPVLSWTIDSRQMLRFWLANGGRHLKIGGADTSGTNTQVSGDTFICDRLIFLLVTSDRLFLKKFGEGRI
jgi:hypothetical protein